MLFKPDSALLLVGHGSTTNQDSSTPTLDHAAAIRQLGLFQEVHCAFWKEEPSLRQILHQIDCADIYIVPIFISEGYFTRTVIPRELGLTGPLTRLQDKQLKYCAPVGNHPRMTELLLRRAAEAAPGIAPSQTSLLIVGHGTSLNDNSAVAAKREAELIRQKGIYAEVLSTYMEEPPHIADWDQLTSQPHVVVVPFFISDGLHSFEDIPGLLGIAPAESQRNIFRQNPYYLKNRSLYYASAIGTEPLFAELILDQVAAIDLAHASEPLAGKRNLTTLLATRIQQGSLRLGQIEITSRPDNGYELRHEDDLTRTDLVEFFGAEAARQLSLTTDLAIFRPLKTAPTLRHGWRLILADAKELRLALDYFYPSMLGVWASLVDGNLPSVPLRETLARQTGMYVAAQRIEEAEARLLAERLCSPASCLKHTLWQLTPEQPIINQEISSANPPKIPLLCHEACNLFVAAARVVVKKRETPSTQVPRV